MGSTSSRAATRRTRRRGSQRGQSVVEFAIVVPILLIFVVAIVDFARLYTTMLTVESAAREAADFGAFNWNNWVPANTTGTATEMQRRACVASSNLTDYTTSGGTCTNPTFAYTLTPVAGGNADCTVEPDPAKDPCRVSVTLTYTFHMIAPVSIDFFGRTFGLPSTVTFDRTSVFSIADFGIDHP